MRCVAVSLSGAPHGCSDRTSRRSSHRRPVRLRGACRRNIARAVEPIFVALFADGIIGGGDRDFNRAIWRESIMPITYPGGFSLPIEVPRGVLGPSTKGFAPIAQHRLGRFVRCCHCRRGPGRRRLRYIEFGYAAVIGCAFEPRPVETFVRPARVSAAGASGQVKEASPSALGIALAGTVDRNAVIKVPRFSLALGRIGQVLGSAGRSSLRCQVIGRSLNRSFQ